MATATKAQHTPGPWTMDKVKTQIGHCYKIGSFKACLYVDNYTMKDDATQLANARLIAAAPELLDGLTDLNESVEQYLAGPSVDNMNKLTAALRFGRAAIAKAEGQ